MTREEFLKALKKAGVKFEHGPLSGRICIDGDIVVLENDTAFIKPASGWARFHTAGNNEQKNLKDVKEDDLKPMIEHYHKFHKYYLMDTVRRIKAWPKFDKIEYTTIAGKHLLGEAAVKALKRDLKKGIKEMEDNR